MVAPRGVTKEALEQKIKTLLRGSTSPPSVPNGIDVTSLGSSSNNNDFIKESDGQDSQKLLASSSSAKGK